MEGHGFSRVVIAREFQPCRKMTPPYPALAAEVRFFHPQNFLMRDKKEAERPHQCSAIAARLKPCPSSAIAFLETDLSLGKQSRCTVTFNEAVVK